MAGTAKQLPTRIQLLKWGVNDSTEGPVIVNDLTLSSFADMQRKIGRESAPLDFEHNTVPGTPEYNRTHEPRAIAAMGRPVVVQGEGIFLESLSYKVGEDIVKNFEDVSAAPLLNKDRVVVGLHSAALTRTGAVYGAHFAAEDVLKLAGDGITLAAFSSKISASLLGADASKQQTKNMPEKYLSIAALAAMVGLEANAEESAVTEALKKRLAPTEIATLSSLVKDGKVVIVETVSALDGRLKKIEDAGTKAIATLSATIDGKVHTFSAEDIVRLAARVGDLEKANKDAVTGYENSQKARILPLFAKEGRVPLKADKTAYTAEELAKLDLPTLELLHANTPVTVATGARKAAGEGVTVVDTASVWNK